MDIREAVRQVANKFHYKKDKTFIDTWSVMREQDGKMYGDCDDFAMTCIWYACDKSLLKFIWHVLILHQYRFYNCKTFDGGTHAAGYAQGKWFDNWTLSAVNKSEFIHKTHHNIRYFYVLPVILIKIIFGLFIHHN